MEIHVHMYIQLSYHTADREQAVEPASGLFFLPTFRGIPTLGPLPRLGSAFGVDWTSSAISSTPPPQKRGCRYHAGP